MLSLSAAHHAAHHSASAAALSGVGQAQTAQKSECHQKASEEGTDVHRVWTLRWFLAVLGIWKIGMKK